MTYLCELLKEIINITFRDPVSWVPETFPGQGNACLWDENLNRKPAYYAVADVLRSAAENGTRRGW